MNLASLGPSVIIENRALKDGSSFNSARELARIRVHILSFGVSTGPGVAVHLFTVAAVEVALCLLKPRLEPSATDE
jgi:hypothetical protein